MWPRGRWSGRRGRRGRGHVSMGMDSARGGGRQCGCRGSRSRLLRGWSPAARRVLVLLSYWVWCGVSVEGKQRMVEMQGNLESRSRANWSERRSIFWKSRGGCSSSMSSGFNPSIIDYLSISSSNSQVKAVSGRYESSSATTQVKWSVLHPFTFASLIFCITNHQTSSLHNTYS